MAKNLVSDQILAHLAQTRATKFFPSEIWLRQPLDLVVSYRHVQYEKNLMIQSWENLVKDRRIYRLTDLPKWFHKTLYD